MSRWLTGVGVEWCHFRALEVRDERGVQLRLRTITQDMADVLDEVTNNPLFRHVARNGSSGRLWTYLTKILGTIVVHECPSFCRTPFVIQLCAWKLRRERPGGQWPVAFLDQQPWMDELVRYGARSGVTVIPVGRPLKLHAGLRRQLTPELREWVWVLKTCWQLARLRLHRQHRRILKTSDRAGEIRASCQRSRVGVQYNGHLNLKCPERHSDLFFWQQSSLAGNDLVVVFKDPWYPLDEPQGTELTACGMEAVVLAPLATTLPTAPVFIHRPQRKYWERPRLALPRRNLNAAWLRDQMSDYRAVQDYWAALCDACGIKVFVTWFKYDAVHCAIAEALRQVGGLLAMYQRAYEFNPSPETAVATDLFFGFSKRGAEIERRSRSVIQYHVTTGYLGDHRFPLLQPAARRVRQELERHGARHVLAYCDENSRADERWYVGNTLMRQHYAFLLERVLMEPWFGLLVKPKAPSTLRQRLGPVSELLQRAEATGRCVVYQDGLRHSSIPPAAAALASDILVHGHLTAGTAAAEATLAGVPTLLLDREGWSISPLHQLGGQVVFTDLDRLWKACLEHWKHPGGVPGFGDWSPMLDDLDPFRDGRAAQRMGTYLNWLLDGFKAGKDRETVMADAAERYGSIWGQDKITTVNASHPNRPETDARLADSAAVGV
ncbi:MAG: hypothetical protein HYY59_07465 [Candidatus Omnitrophica bacterium]|nr:hypothetical protein [Candidatus Omnitrophota bacterium]